MRRVLLSMLALALAAAGITWAPATAAPSHQAVPLPCTVIPASPAGRTGVTNDRACQMLYGRAEDNNEATVLVTIAESEQAARDALQSGVTSSSGYDLQPTSQFGDGAGAGYASAERAESSPGAGDDRSYLLMYVSGCWNVIVQADPSVAGQFRQVAAQIGANIKAQPHCAGGAPPEAAATDFVAHIGCGGADGEIACTAQSEGKRPDAEIEFEWTLDGVRQARRAGTFEFHGITAGEHTIQVVAVDVTNNLRSAPDSVQVTLTGGAEAPFTVTLQGCRFEESDRSVTCAAAAQNAPADADLVYEWQFGGAAQGGQEGSVMTARNVAKGAHIVTVWATDATSGRRTSAATSVVEVEPDQAPTAVELELRQAAANANANEPLLREATRGLAPEAATAAGDAAESFINRLWPGGNASVVATGGAVLVETAVALASLTGPDGRPRYPAVSAALPGLVRILGATTTPQDLNNAREYLNKLIAQDAAARGGK